MAKTEKEHGNRVIESCLFQINVQTPATLVNFIQNFKWQI